MLIYKEPGQLAETPWHQDFAYAGMPFTPAGANIPYDESVQFWLALDDVDEENGCMHFVPGGHLDPLHPHHVAGGAPTDPGRLLAMTDPEHELDLATAVSCPLAAGGATVHSFGTPHYTSGNRTADRPRRAFIFNFARKGLDSLLNNR
jgi:ectoine hydroxylase-related dioxygenase (phytanoyl-CoA dioxygenase family)